MVSVKLLVLCFELELVFVSCIYLPLNDLEVTVPIIKGEILRQDVPLVEFKCSSDRNDNCDGVKFQSDSSEVDGLQVSDDGKVFVTSETIKRVTDQILDFRIKMSPTSGPIRSAGIKVRTLPLDELDCDKVVEEVCFWKTATFVTSSNFEKNILGTLTSPYLTGLCGGYKISYEIVTGKNVELVPPSSNRSEPWSISTIGPIGDEKIEVSCSIENSIGLRSGTSRTIRRSFDIKSRDVTGQPIRTQESDASYYFNSRMVKKGLNLEPPIIFFDDNVNSNLTEYRPSVVGEDRIRAECKRWNLTNSPAKTAIHCRLSFEEDVTFRSSRKNFYLRLVSSTDSRVEAKIPIHLLFDIAPETLTVRSQKLFPNRPIKIFRTAGPLARVAQPSNCKRCKKFTLTDRTVKMVFNITEDEGIVFVHDFVELRKSPEYVNLNVSWYEDDRREFDELQLRIVDEPNQTCANVKKRRDWTFCAEQETPKDCERSDLCAIATGGVNYFDIRNIKGFPHRCMWRGDDNSPNITHAYSTCTPDIKTCPDGVCDSLERLHELICPQDCTTEPLVPLKVNHKTGRGIDSASGTVVCFSTNTCTLIPSQPRIQPKVKAKPKPKLNLAEVAGQFNSSSSQKYTGFNVGDCGTLCMLGIATGLVLLGAGAIATMLFWRRNRKRKIPRDKILEPENRELVENRRQLDEFSNLPLTFRMTTNNCDRFKRLEDPKWEFPRTQLVIEQTLGEGEFGRVLKAKATDIKGRKGFTPVAVKTLKDDARDSELNDLLSEYKLLKEVSHQNVIGLLGVCTSPGGPIYVIIEYAEYGSLRNYLRRSRKLYQDSPNVNLNYYDEPKSSEITSKDLLSFAWQVCNGMAYLSDIKLVHRDLAARNVLLTVEKVCKISDFGLTRDIYEDNAYLKRSKGRVPVKWMAPESLSDHIYTSKSDVWSFGVLIWELVTLGATPYPGVAIQNLFHLLKQGYRMERPDNCSPGLYKIMRSCWDIDPEKRPSFQKLLKCWEELLEDKMEYMNLSNSAVVNRGYFMAPFGQTQEIPEEEEEDPDEENSNLNAGSKRGSEEKIQKVRTAIDGMLKGDATGYETPVKIKGRAEAGYTDMSGQDAQ